MLREAKEKCPVCGVAALSETDTNAWQLIGCENCGRHRFFVATLESLPVRLVDRRDRPRLAFGVRGVPDKECIDDKQIGDILRVTKLPPAMERVERLITYMAGFQEPGYPIYLHYKWLSATLGCETSESSKWVLDTATALRYVERAGSVSDEYFLTITGWQRYHSLVREGPAVRTPLWL